MSYAVYEVLSVRRQTRSGVVCPVVVCRPFSTVIRAATRSPSQLPPAPRRCYRTPRIFVPSAGFSDQVFPPPPPHPKRGGNQNYVQWKDVTANYVFKSVVGIAFVCVACDFGLGCARAV